MEETAKHGLKPKPEVGIQYVPRQQLARYIADINIESCRWGAGGDASVTELKSAGTRDPKWLIDQANVFLQAGAHVGITPQSLADLVTELQQ